MYGIAAKVRIHLYDMRDLDSWIDGFKAGAGDSDDDILGKLDG